MALNLHPKIQERQKLEKPIMSSKLSITESGELEIRKSKLKDRVVEGIAVVWGKKNDHDEIFLRGAFAKSIQELGPGSNSPYQIKFRDRHGKACALFETIEEREAGLFFRTKPLDRVSFADELLIQIESGSVNNFSIGFKHNWNMIEWDDENDAMVNKEARLFEISAVDIPSDMNTYAIRSQEELPVVTEEVEQFIIENLPRKLQLEARILFTRCMSLRDDKPHQQRRNALKDKKPTETGLDWEYISKQLIK